MSRPSETLPVPPFRLCQPGDGFGLAEAGLEEILAGG